MRPAAPPATGPASMPTTLAPASSTAPTAASPEPPSPTTQTSAVASPSSAAGFSHAAGSPHTGVAAATVTRGMLPDDRGAVRPGRPSRFARACRPSRRRRAGSSRRPRRPASRGCSRSAPTSSPARCSPPTAPGIFPMPLTGVRELPWFSPDPRGVVPLGDFRPSRSLRRSARRFTVTADAAFGAVIAGCADPRPAGRLDHARDPRRIRAAARARLGALDRGLGRGAARSPAGSTASRSAACSPPSRSSTSAPTRPRWRSPRSWSGCATRAASACSTCSGRRRT